MLAEISSNYFLTNIASKGEAPNFNLIGTKPIVLLIFSRSCPYCTKQYATYFEISEELGATYDFYTQCMDLEQREILEHVGGTMTPTFIKVTETGQIMSEALQTRQELIDNLEL